MMNNDLEQGMVGHLDELYPGISKDDLYGSARRGGVEDVPEMGDLVLLARHGKPLSCGGTQRP